MESELHEHKERAIQALEVKLALMRGLPPPIQNYKVLLAWFDEQTAIDVLNNCRRGFYSKLTLRQSRSLDDQVATYNVPIPGGAPISIPRVLQWFHDWLAKNGPKLKTIADARDRRAILEERKLEQEVKMIGAKMIDIEISIATKQGTAVAIKEVRTAFTWLSSEWRKFGERLGSKFGADSQRFLNEFLERIERDVDEYIPATPEENAK